MRVLLHLAMSPLAGGEQITIVGSGFAGSISVSVGGKTGAVEVNNSTQVVATLPAVGPGSYPLQLHVGDAGVADIR